MCYLRLNILNLFILAECLMATVVRVRPRSSLAVLGVRFVSQAVTPRVCVVGAGPAGFYVTQHLIKNHASVEVDIYERLPVPFGLVRYGVAPDHPEVKNVINTFNKTAHNSRVNFYGNVSLGENVSLRELRQAYHAVILTYGAEKDQELGVEGENLSNVVSARQFVGWYNGLPAERHLPVSLDCDTVAVLGQGNVALDVARMLLTPVDILKKTDVAAHAVAELATSRVRRVVLVGRRGPLQVAFTIKELREMLRLPHVHTLFTPGQMDGVSDQIPNLARPRRRLTELLVQAAAATTPPPPSSSHKTFHLMFLRSPIQFTGDTRVSAVQLAINILNDQRAIATGAHEMLECGLVLRSIGYRSVPADPDLPFDTHRAVVNQSTGLYAAGWVATGPVGVILTTMSNAFTTGATVCHDLLTGTLDTSTHQPSSTHILALLRQRGVPTVDWAGWERIDRLEVQRGQQAAKTREKMVDVAEMLEVGGSLR